MKIIILVTFFGYFFLFIVGCQTKPTGYTFVDTPTEGTIYISVDETFKNIVADQIRVYEATYPKTHIVATYKPESKCFEDLQQDSTRMIIVSRGLTRQESNFYRQKISYAPLWDVVAYDAVAVIVHQQNKDSVYSLKKIHDILKGKLGITAIVDGKKATSTIRYLHDSILQNDNFGKNVVAVSDSKMVVTTVSQNPSCIGFVGLSWINNSYDPQQVAYNKQIRLCAVECKVGEKGFVALPSQSTLMQLQYPFIIPICYILKENATGLGTGFANFLSLERGQLVFKQAFLAPAKIDFMKRKVNIAN